MVDRLQMPSQSLAAGSVLKHLEGEAARHDAREAIWLRGDSRRGPFEITYATAS